MISYLKASMYLRTSLLHNSLSNVYDENVACIYATASAAINSLFASSANTVLVYAVLVIAVLVPTNAGFDPVEFT